MEKPWGCTWLKPAPIRKELGTSETSRLPQSPFFSENPGYMLTSSSSGPHAGKGGDFIQEIGKDVGPRNPPYPVMENPYISPISCAFMSYNPQEFLENTVNTMGTLVGVHPTIPWFMGRTTGPNYQAILRHQELYLQTVLSTNRFETYQRHWIISGNGKTKKTLQTSN